MYLAANRHVVSMYPDVITSLPIGVQSISACLNVCGFVDISLCPLAVSKTTCPNFTKFSVLVTCYSRGSVLL